MRILLIGNFAPPYEEESLHNLSFLKKLEAEGHECTVINTSEHSATESRFIEAKNYINFSFKLLSACWKQDVVHFFTKGYLRLGLLKLITSILVGTIYRARTFITILKTKKKLRKIVSLDHREGVYAFQKMYTSKRKLVYF